MLAAYLLSSFSTLQLSGRDRRPLTCSPNSPSEALSPAACPECPAMTWHIWNLYDTVTFHQCRSMLLHTGMALPHLTCIYRCSNERGCASKSSCCCCCIASPRMLLCCAAARRLFNVSLLQSSCDLHLASDPSAPLRRYAGGRCMLTAGWEILL